MLAAFQDRVQVVGQAVGAERALSVINDLNPDIVLCDVRMQGASGLDLCLELRERDPGRKVVMLSVYDDEQYLFPGAARRRIGLSAEEHQQRRARAPARVRAQRGDGDRSGMAARAVDTAARLHATSSGRVSSGTDAARKRDPVVRGSTDCRTVPSPPSW